MPNKDCPKLRECPLCGSEANIVGGPEDWRPTSYDPDSGGDPYSVVCTGCECGMALAFWDIDEAIKAWNRRADHSGEANKMVEVVISKLENAPLTLDELRGMGGEAALGELTRCKDCESWDKSISFMGAHACAFWSPSREKPRYTQEYDFCSMCSRKPLNGGKVDGDG